MKVDHLPWSYLVVTNNCPEPSEYKIPGSQWVCYLQKHWVVKQLYKCLWERINGLEALRYWQWCHQITTTIWDTIDWDALARAYKEVPIAKHYWTSKWTLGHFSHGENLAWWQFWLSAAYPLCGMTLEDKLHVIHCPESPRCPYLGNKP